MRPGVDINGVVLPIEDLHLAYITKLIGEEYGFLESSRQGLAVDGEGMPLPLYTYPCIEYLSNIDFLGAKVFEWGCGYSSLWWTNWGADYHGVEPDMKWVDAVKSLRANIDVVYKTGDDYINAIYDIEGKFDVIIIDGGDWQSAKYRCIEPAVHNLNSGGMIILDNSDRYINCKEKMDSYKDFIPIHFNGLRSNTVEAMTTSCYIHREFNRKTVIQTPVGGIHREEHTSDAK